MDYRADQHAVMQVLEPYLSRMEPLFHASIKQYTDHYSEYARAIHSNSAAAHNVYCHILDGFRQEFVEEGGFHFLDVRGLTVLNICDQVVVRLKKVDPDGRHRNLQTKQQEDFDNQQELQGIPPAASRVVMGYEPDAAMEQVQRVIVRSPYFGWVAQIVEDVEVFSWSDITPARLPFGSTGSYDIGEAQK